MNIVKADWDILIVLDACRFDYFAKHYRKFIKKGFVQPVISNSVQTMEWLNKNFPDYYDDIVYISANPYINSKVSLTSKYGDCYNAKDHFYKIVDVWDWGWKENNTIPPEEVNKSFAVSRMKHPGKRFILHYVQPHEPYIHPKYLKYIPKKAPTDVLADIQTAKKHKKSVKDFISTGFRWSLSQKMHTSGVYSQPKSIYLNEGGWKGIREAYKQNLLIVLKYVKEIVDHFDCKIVITADHGEFLGEHGLYGHPNDVRKQENTEVPWLEINGHK